MSCYRKVSWNVQSVLPPASQGACADGLGCAVQVVAEFEDYAHNLLKVLRTTDAATLLTTDGGVSSLQHALQLPPNGSDCTAAAIHNRGLRSIITSVAAAFPAGDNAPGCTAVGHSSRHLSL